MNFKSFMMNLGIIGYERGKKLIEIIKKTKLKIKVTAIYDLNPKIEKLAETNPIISVYNSKEKFFNSRKFESLYIASPVKFHYEHTMLAIKNNLNILCEIPAFRTINEGKKIKSKLRNGKIIYMMAENYCYIPKIIALNKLIRQNKFGEIIFVRSSYIHDCKKLCFDKYTGELTWRGNERKINNGNDYPTHSMGPVHKLLENNKRFKDNLKCISSYNNRESIFSDFYFNKFPQKFKKKFKRGNYSISIIETKRKNIIELICDTTSSRPSSMADMYIQGTKGTYISGRYDDEKPIVSFVKKNGYTKFKKFEYLKLLKKKDLDLIAKLGKLFPFYKTIENFTISVKTKVSPSINFSDAFVWSSIIELSKKSLIKNSKKIYF